LHRTRLQAPLSPGLLYKNSTSGLYRIYGASGWEALGGASGDDGLLDIVAPASSPYNILADDTGKWIINTASESDWTLNLPTATVGLHYHFTQAWDSVNLDIRPQGGEGFRNEGAFFARMAVIGGSLEVGCAEAGTWDVLDSYQAFTFQNPAPPPA